MTLCGVAQLAGNRALAAKTIEQAMCSHRTESPLCPAVNVHVGGIKLCNLCGWRWIDEKDA